MPLAHIDGDVKGLGFLHILEWAEALRLTSSFAENPLRRPDRPDLSILRGTAESPVAILLRTTEPCDWRRVIATVVTRDGDTPVKRFTTRLAPSPDGCSCLFLLEAEKIPVRVPAGELVLSIRFLLDAPDLPRLRDMSDPVLSEVAFAVPLLQPFGRTWPA